MQTRSLQLSRLSRNLFVVLPAQNPRRAFVHVDDVSVARRGPPKLQKRQIETQKPSLIRSSRQRQFERDCQRPFRGTCIFRSDNEGRFTFGMFTIA